MRRLVFVIIFLFYTCFVTPSIARAEVIQAFDATYDLQQDGTITVEERIVYDFGDMYRHGIYRTIPYLTTNAEGKKFIVDFSDFHVRDEYGASYNFSKNTIDETQSLKIGNADKTITGIHVYDIGYKVSGGMRYFSDHDEFYWNVTGNGWEIPILKVSATTKLPQAVDKKDVKIACYTGIAGSSESQCHTSYVAGRAVVTASSPLGSGEGLTIVVGIPKNIVAMIEPKPYVPFWETTSGKIALIAIVILGISWYIIYPLYLPILWWQHGRDPKPTTGEATAWFDAPKTKDGRSLTPGETGALVDEKVDMQDITSSIVHLAQRGFIRILEPKKGDFSLEKIKHSDTKKETLEPFEKKILSGFFASGDVVSLKSGSMATAAEDIKNSLYDAVIKEKFFDTNPQSKRTAYTVLAILAFFTGNMPLVLSALIFGLNMPKKTLLGSNTAAVARSLKNFLTSQERQLAFQAKNQMFFEKLLPYAIAFGVEKIWAERFRDIAMKPPSYYHGYSTNNFNSIIFVNSLNATSSKIASAATPVSSSTGHSSGFSGGFSGGGGGGGGGGSW